uniref:NrS-1 polymerase-like helicase domain-containing protein n=1 Tax=Rhizophagus irregularis (strain DAOM 181602 / DAOM 197198 / MUCL 43194) TaxID=747089 RepID=U9V847_RHIID
MCASKKKLTRNEVYDAIQATIACVSKESRAWILKHKNSDGGLYFGMNHKLDIGKRTINIRSELGGEPIKLISLIKKTEDDCFKAKPASQINCNLVNPILWHIENVLCGGECICPSVDLASSFRPSFLVLRSPHVAERIFSNFIRKRLFEPERVYSTSDLGKILGKFNSAVQGRKLIIMNETRMAKDEWQKANGHLKSLITEDYVLIERKGLEPQVCGHYPGFMVLSNHDSPIQVEKEMAVFYASCFNNLIFKF